MSPKAKNDKEKDKKEDKKDDKKEDKEKDKKEDKEKDKKEDKENKEKDKKEDDEEEDEEDDNSKKEDKKDAPKKKKRRARSLSRKKKTKKVDDGEKKEKKTSSKPKNRKSAIEQLEIGKYWKASTGAAKRESKKPSLYAPASPGSTITVEEGKGQRLGDIDNVEFRIRYDYRKESTFLKLLHKLFFGTPGRKDEIKNHLYEFSGLVYSRDDKENDRLDVIDKLGAWDSDDVKEACGLFDIDISGKKSDDRIEALVDFLERPKRLSKESLKDKRREERSRSRSPQRKSSSSRSRSPAKKSSSSSKSRSSRSSSRSSRSSSRGRSSSRRSSSKKKSSVKKARSAYTFFLQDHQDDVKHLDPKDRFARIGKMWKECSSSKREKYDDMAADDKKRADKERKAEKSR